MSQKLNSLYFCEIIKKLLLLFFICTFCTSFSQELKDTDSLLTVLKSTKLTQREKAKLLTKIAYDHPSPSESLIYAKQSLDLAIELNDEILQAEAWEEISHVERRLGNNINSFNASLKALNIYENKKLFERQSASYVQIASNYITDEDYPTAIIYLKKAKKIYRETNNDLNLALTMINLGEAYRLYNQLDSSTIYFKKALELNHTQHSDIILGYASGNLGMVYEKVGKIGEAKDNLEMSISILSELGDSYSTSIYMAELGSIYKNEKKYNIAEKKYQEAMAIAKQANLKEQIRDINALFTALYEEQGMYDKALVHQKKFQIYQDSLINKKNIQQIEQLKAGYEIGHRESEILRLNEIGTNRKRLNIGLLISIGTLGLFLYLLYRTNNHLSQQKEIIAKREKEKALLLSELNHRVKNNLQLISSLLNLQSNELSGHPAKEALVTSQYRVEALSLVHRKLYQEGAESKVELKEYVEELVFGLFHSYNMNFKPEISVDPITINIDAAVPIALIINELVTNAIKYAYKNNNDPALKICVKNKKHKVTIDILDNGQGFSKKEQSKSNSLGIKLVTSLAIQLGGELKKIEHQGTHWNLTLNNIKL